MLNVHCKGFCGHPPRNSHASFAGQTGSGKTHTLIGDVTCEQGKGVVPRAVRELADCIAKDTEGNTYKACPEQKIRMSNHVTSPKWLLTFH